MLHLHKHNLIHRDLAARNILLKQGEPKVSDFGMSRLLQVDATAGKTYGNIGPVRWMAPESLKNGIYSIKSVSNRTQKYSNTYSWLFYRTYGASESFYRK